jgi:tetratricopeptide (TPR) repeat protein
MIPISSTELISEGRAACEAGLFEKAIKIFEAACVENPEAVEPKEELFNALRQSALSQYLGDFFVETMGWTRKQYYGFSDINQATGFNSTEPQLHKLSKQISGLQENTDNFRLQVIVDRQAMGVSDAVEDFGFEKPDDQLTGLDCFFKGKMELERGHFEKAGLILSTAMKKGFHGVPVYQLLGETFYRLGKSDKALYFFSLALAFPASHWFDEGQQQKKGILKNLETYKGLSLYFFEGRYYAVDEWEGVHFAHHGNAVLVYKYSTLRRLHDWLLATMPEGIIKFLKLISQWPLVRRGITVGIETAKVIVKRPSLLDVLAEIDSLEGRYEGAPTLVRLNEQGS